MARRDHKDDLGSARWHLQIDGELAVVGEAVVEARAQDRLERHLLVLQLLASV